MILIINICNEKLGYYEYVKPIESVLKNKSIKFFTRDYNKINKNDLKKADKVIICGTSLKDNGFVRDIAEFEWIKDYKKSILGICGGMQIIGLIFGGKLSKETEIGYYNENFNKEYLGLKDKQEVYHLHNNYVDFERLKKFEVFSGKKISQAVKYKNKEIYGVLFHPEVRQKDLIARFCSLGNG
jgi:GMP synthase-like glutamine amidotransferase